MVPRGLRGRAAEAVAGRPPVLLLHGLAGHAGEWDSTAAWLRERWHVVATDAPGHGDGERFPADVSPAAHLAAAASAVEQLGLGPAVVVGQSLGGLTALRLAAARPDLVRALVIAEASPGRADDPDAAAAEVSASLRRWPLPFPSHDGAVAFFGAHS